MRNLLVLALLALSTLAAEKKVYPERWVYVSRSLSSDRHVADIREIARTASEHGLTGLVLAIGLDQIDVQPPAWIARLQQVKQICDQYHLDIIPTGFNVGYGGALLAHDRNLAAGMPVKGALFVAGQGSATFQPDPAPKLPTAVPLMFPENIATDPAVPHNGQPSFRLTSAPKATGDDGPSLKMPVNLKPNRCYRLRFWVKTQGFTGGDRLLIVRADEPKGRNLCPFERTLPASSEWTQFDAGFNTWYASNLTLSVGQNGRAGKIWIAGLTLDEVGLTNVIRRPGTPLVVRGEKNGVIYKEGKDFAPVKDPTLTYRWNHEGPAITLTPATRIQPGERLRVDYYHGTTIYQDQVSACISEPRVMKIWRKQFPLIQKYVAPKKYLLALDEVRLEGHCEDCRRQNKPMAQILGDYCVQLQKMVQEFSPGATSWVWSDMWDPNHNSKEQYYLVNGSTADSWKYLPKDIHIAAWYFEKRKESLAFFSSHGFKTLAGAYYDADDLKNPQGWLETLDQTEGAEGIMYTTWSNKYKLLAPFGDLVSSPR